MVYPKWRRVVTHGNINAEVAFMEWNKRYETGNEVVDSEHKEIFRLVKEVLNDVFASNQESISTSMDFLTGYVLRHFGHEESLMDESAYPEARRHKSQHQLFAQRVTNLIEKIKKENDDMQMSVEINETIVNWLVEHVLGSDKMLADYYKKWRLKQAEG